MNFLVDTINSYKREMTEQLRDLGNAMHQASFASGLATVFWSLSALDALGAIQIYLG